MIGYVYLFGMWLILLQNSTTVLGSNLGLLFTLLFTFTIILDSSYKIDRMFAWFSHDEYWWRR